MKSAILQPNYIPWRGYFDLISEVDTFVFYDDVQYTKRDWRNRNKIKTPNGMQWLTVPVINQHVHDLKINQVRIDYSSNWIDIHLNSLKHFYSRSNYYKLYIGEFEDILNSRNEYLVDLNISICKWIVEILDIKTIFKRSSELDCQGSKNDKLICILKKLKSNHYITGPASLDYIDFDLFKYNDIKITFKKYEYRDYIQLWGDFIGEVSILDLLFNVGPNAFKYLKTY